MNRISKDFYKQDALVVAPNLLGKILVRKLDNGDVIRYLITETEAYVGEIDSACHARFGKTNRTKIFMRKVDVHIYTYVMDSNLLNIVTGKKMNQRLS